MLADDQTHFLKVTGDIHHEAIIERYVVARGNHQSSFENTKTWQQKQLQQ